jgi:hypothetical protein
MRTGGGRESFSGTHLPHRLQEARTREHNNGRILHDLVIFADAQ